MENSKQKIKLNFLLILCFWSNQISSNGTASMIEVLDSINHRTVEFVSSLVYMILVQHMHCSDHDCDLYMHILSPVSKINK